MKKNRIFINLMLVLFLGTFLAPAAEGIDNTTQNPRLTNVDLQVSVTFNPVNRVYSYSYTISSGPENLGEIYLFDVDISTLSRITPAPDPDLISDISFSGNDAPARTVPVGILSPFGWLARVGVTGAVNWGAIRAPNIQPGQSLSNFVIQSKSPPGPRKFKIEPFFDTTGFPEGAELMPNLPKPEDFFVLGQTIGPVLAEELKLINAKGQRASDVNTFLRYSNPTATSTTLPSGVKKFDLAVFFGSTILPATFKAELNGVVITPKFSPSPGGFNVVRLDLANGSNTLILSVEGVRTDGNQGRDTDRLTFKVPTP